MEIEIPSFEHVNLYKDNVDLPQIKPRTINNRNEFYIAVPPLHSQEISKEDARRAIGHGVLEDYEQRHLAPLRQLLKDRQEIHRKKHDQLMELKSSHSHNHHNNRWNNDNHNQMGGQGRRNGPRGDNYQHGN